MKKIFPFIISILINLNFSAQGIEFKSDNLETLKAKAKSENKLIFIDAYTSWCGPCKWMASNVFINDTVGKFFNEHFISSKIDMEKGEGIKFAEKYNVMCYPNFLILDSNGEIIHRKAGSMQKKELISFGNEVFNKSKTYAYFKNNLEKENTNQKFLQEYIEYMKNTCVDISPLVANYFDKIDSSEYLAYENWRMILFHVNDVNSKPFKYFQNHADEFSKKYTSDSVNLKLYYTYNQFGRNLFYIKPFDANKINSFVGKLENSNLKPIRMAALSLKLSLLNKSNDLKNYELELIKNGDSLLHNDICNEVVWNLYEKSSNEKLLMKAKNWINNLITHQKDDENNFAELDTYAHILFKLKQNQEALKIANLAIEKAMKFGMKEVEYQETKELILKLK